MVRAPEPAQTPTHFTLSGRDVGQPDGVPAAMASVRSLTAGYDPANDVDLTEGTFEKGLNNVVKDNDMNFPPEWRLSRSGRAKP